MELLLDTHAALWWAAGGNDTNDSLAPEAADAIASRSNTVWFSVASAWELAIKVRSGRLVVDVEKLVVLLTRNGARMLGIGIDDAIAAGALNWTHKDPFDRMLVAQASRLGLTLVTRDEPIRRFTPNHLLA